jgi:excisionase family DNA binding protein
MRYMRGKYLTIKQLAAELDVHRVTVSRWISRGELRVVRIGGIVRIPESERVRLTTPHAARRGRDYV